MDQQIDPGPTIDSSTKKRCLHSLWIADYETKLRLVPNSDPGTCTWVSGHPQYLEWSSGKKEPIIWLLGGPGSGKTVLSAYLIREFQRTSKRTLVTYFHCARDQAALSSTEAILSSILHQILAKNNHLIDHAVREYETRPRGFSDSLGTLCNVLENVLQDSNCPSIYCILDALDECTNPLALLKEISTHYDSSMRDNRRNSTASPIRYLITSQPDLNFEKYAALVKFSSIIDMSTAQNFRSREQDIRLSIKERVAALKFSPRIKTKIQSHLERGADGMYLWVSLTLDELSRTLSGNVDQVLRSTPRNLNERYARFLSQIRKRSKGWVYKIILLVVTALRPLSITEMYYALKLWEGGSVNVNKPLDEDTLRNFKEDLRLCGLIIRVQDTDSLTSSSQGSIVTLVHPTAKDFLTRSTDLAGSFYIDLKTNHTTFGTICMDYLFYMDLGQTFAVPATIREQACEKFKRAVAKTIDLQKYSKRYPLLEYATRSWLQHCTNASQKPSPDFFERFRTFARLDATRWKWLWWRMNVPNSMDMRNISYNDAQVKPYVRKALETYQSRRETRNKPEDPIIETMLFLMRDLQTSPLLPVLWRANKHWLPLQDEYGRTLLHYAALEGWTHFSDLLAQYMRDSLDIQDHAQNTAIHIAVMPGHEDLISARTKIVKCLLDEGAKTEVKDASGMTPLLLAIQFGMYEMVKLLLDFGSADVGAVEDYEGTELDLALEISGNVVHKDGGTIKKVLESHLNRGDWVIVE